MVLADVGGFRHLSARLSFPFLTSTPTPTPTPPPPPPTSTLHSPHRPPLPHHRDPPTHISTEPSQGLHDHTAAYVNHREPQVFWYVTPTLPLLHPQPHDKACRTRLVATWPPPTTPPERRRHWRRSRDRGTILRCCCCCCWRRDPAPPVTTAAAVLSS